MVNCSRRQSMPPTVSGSLRLGDRNSLAAASRLAVRTPTSAPAQWRFRNKPSWNQVSSSSPSSSNPSPLMAAVPGGSSPPGEGPFGVAPPTAG